MRMIISMQVHVTTHPPYLSLKESLHIISGAIFYSEINRISSLKHGLVMGMKSLKRK